MLSQSSGFEIQDIISTMEILWRHKAIELHIWAVYKSAYLQTIQIKSCVTGSM